MEGIFLKRLMTYQMERFPFVKNGVFILLFYAGTHNLFLFLYGYPYRFHPNQIIGFITLFLIFFQLRLFDEIKDFQVDSDTLPDRPVQRGVISLNEVKVLSGIVTILIIILNVFCGLDNLLKTLVLEAFIFLMLKEFFLGERLRMNRVVYAALHMLVMPFMAFYIGGHTSSSVFSLEGIWVFVMVYLTGFIIEVGRKIEAPGSELPGVDTYSKLLGPRGAAYLYLVMVIIFSMLSGGVVSLCRVMLVSPILLGFLFVFINTIRFIRYLKPGMPERMNLSGQIFLMINLTIFTILPYWGCHVTQTL